MGKERHLHRVGVVCSYVKRSGIGELHEVFSDLEARNIPVRLLTTTMMGISEPGAIRQLASFNNVTVKVLSASENIHANAWRFHGGEEADDGHRFSSAIVGSSNV